LVYAPGSARRNGRANRRNKPITATNLGADEAAVFAESPAQSKDLHFQVPLGDDDPRPDTGVELLFADQRSIGLNQSQQKLECARTQRHRHAIGHQSTLT
jgi:hypothetical protein